MNLTVPKAARAGISVSVAAAARAAIGDLPVIVLGGHVTGLGVLRALAPTGALTYLVSERRDYAGASRWARRLPYAPAESADPEPLASFLGGLPFERALLLPCSDDWTRAVARLPDEVRERFPSPLASAATLDHFLDKELFAALVEHVGAPHPRTAVVLPDTSGPLDGFELGPGGVQLFLKPTDSQRFVRHFAVKALRVSDPHDAEARLREIWATGIGSMLVQEYIPGPASSHYFVDGYMTADGRTVARLVRRRLRMYPPDFGNSTYHVTVPPEEAGAAVEHLERLLGYVGFRGIFSAEFKRDERDGELKILEVNVRPWWYVHFAAVCGVNVCELAYREALGLPLEPVGSYKVGARCVLVGADLRAFAHQRRHGRAGPGRWLASWVGATPVVFSRRDPLPGLLHVWGVATRWLRRRAGRSTRTT